VVELDALFTVCSRLAEVLLLKLASPAYETVMVWAVTDNGDVVKVALPLDRLAVPKVVAPSRKVTVPVGVPTAGETALTVAVNVTACPNTDGLTDEVTLVLLFPREMVKLLDVALVNVPEVAAKVYPVPALFTVRVLNVAVPLTAATVSVPPSVAPVGLVPKATVTLGVLDVRFPN
jgi:hypothetical protein